MWLFLRSSHLKLGKQSNKSSGNEEIKFPSKYKNWNSGKKTVSIAVIKGECNLATSKNAIATMTTFAIKEN